MSPYQTTGNICVALAALIFLVPLNYLLWEYARKHLSDSSWVTPALYILTPMWLLLMAGLLCVTGSGGFDWLRLGRPALYVLTVAAALALTVVSFVLVGSYIRPGFAPSFIYYLPLLLVLLATMLLIVLSLNPQLGISPRTVRLPWTIGAGLCLVGGVGFGGYWLATEGVGGIANIAQRLNGPSSQEILTKVSTLDPQTGFDELLGLATRYASREIREAATARLRSHPDFPERLSTELETGYVEPAVEFLYSATLTPAEQARLASPARSAMQRWVGRIPAPNYTTKKNLRDLRRWGTEMFGVLPEKFASTGVDFAPVIADFKERVDPT
ncbi:MAG: hypothetical protein ABI599_11370 [Flavobacteriales bacterium]